MDWVKKGSIYCSPFDGSWRDNSALTPTAFLLSANIIRNYVSFRDANGTGRIGYVDVDADDPSKVLKISDQPVLDVGVSGMFDDNGVILGDVIRVGEKVHMYYVGFQLVKNVKFLAYSGLAISTDNGDTFARYSHTPILDRSDEGLFIRAIHSIIFENEKFKIWYATGNGWENINGVDFPQYDISYLESGDGIHFEGRGIKCITNDLKNFEYRIGRPRVYRRGGSYIMNFTYGTLDGRYMAGQAKSLDGIGWIRDDQELGIDLSADGWDSTHLSYPSVIDANGKTYMFYNGNNMGKDGFGFAELSNG